MTHTFSNILVHFVWSTKDRAPSIQNAFSHRLHEYVRSIAENHNAIIVAINSMPDHVHMLARLKVTTEIPKFMRDVKVASTKWIRQQMEGCERFSWQEGYGAFSVGQQGYEKVISYIDNQQLHHKNKSFDEEYVELLQKLKIPYDPRFVLG